MLASIRPVDVPVPSYYLQTPDDMPYHPLSHLSSTDQALFSKYGVGPSRPVEYQLVHHSFEHHARTQPNTIAVEHTTFSESITYAELDNKANALARRLQAAGIRPGKRVVIVARRSIPFVVGVLGVLKAGGQYVPLDAVTITDETLDFVLTDAEPSVVLVMTEYSHRIRLKNGKPVIKLEEAIAADNGLLIPKPEECGLSPSDGCYCIYTSGTTGRPKGVDVRHQGVSNVISAPPGNVNMSPGLRVAQLLNIAFDMGAWEILGSLYNGCTLCLRGNSKKDWIALLKTVHIVIATPSILSLHSPEDYPELTDVIVGGEPCPQALADKWATCRPGRLRFFNCCGPTEISICNTIQPHLIPGTPISIGKPIPNTNVYILSCDEAQIPVPIGHIGSMWVGGIGVSNGYLNLPDKTAERWRKDPFTNGMMFNTGDLARWLPSGQLEHLGRADDQVKVKGFRVELDGVSSSIRSASPLIKSAVTLLIEGELWGFVAPRKGIDLSELRNHVAKSQPYYAVPNHFMAMDDFPHTSNGKVDKRFLRALAAGERREGVEVIKCTYTSPTSPSPPTATTPALKVTEARWTPPMTPSEPSPSESSPAPMQQLQQQRPGAVSPLTLPSPNLVSGTQQTFGEPLPSSPVFQLCAPPAGVVNGYLGDIREGSVKVEVTTCS